MLRQPLRTIYSKIQDTATAATTKTFTDTFLLPFTDFDSLIVKNYCNTLTQTGGSYANIYIQTTDDGGTTWFDAISLPLTTATGSNAAARWANLSATKVGSTVTTSASDGTLSAGSYGVPLLSNYVRVKWVLTSVTTLTQYADTTVVYANTQSSYK